MHQATKQLLLAVCPARHGQLYGRLKVQLRNQRETPTEAQCGMTATRLSAAPSMA